MTPDPGNGGHCDRYHWEQTLMEVTVYYYLPEGTTAKDLKVDFGVHHCKIAIKGQEPLVDADWHKKIKVDESLWTVERDGDGEHARSVMQVCLTKHVDQNWWGGIWKGDHEINTGECKPENTKIHELDSQTRYHVEKEMFNQRQKQKGGPSADEVVKRE